MTRRWLWLGLAGLLVGGCARPGKEQPSPYEAALLDFYHQDTRSAKPKSAYDIRFAMRPWPPSDPHYPNECGERIYRALLGQRQMDAFGVKFVRGDGQWTNGKVSITHRGATLSVEECITMTGSCGTYFDYRVVINTDGGDCPAGDGPWLDTLQKRVEFIADSMAKIRAVENMKRDSTFRERVAARDARVEKWKAQYGY